MHSEFHKSGLCLSVVAGKESAGLMILLGAVPLSQNRDCPEGQACISSWEGAEEVQVSSWLQSTGILVSLDALAEVSCLLFLCWHPLQVSRGGAEISLKTIYYFQICPCLDLQSCCSSVITFLTPICFFL